uniref:ATP synthase complex subunit 8 n=1 Tax=Scolytinae sp. BMNH 1274713 TaxID=1796544 RepID=A0A126TG84_9CUCU|nr:ATP synthase F0 subunit 8 [Scolytinae sp. BMNH 1274713]
MPQMAPISWMTLYLFFSVLFALMCILNFFMFSYSPKMSTLMKKEMILNWKW